MCVPVKVGLQQGSALRPCLLTLIMDNSTIDINDIILWCISFANDIVLFYLMVDDVVVIIQVRKQPLKS